MERPSPAVEAVRRAREGCDPDDVLAFEAFVLFNDDARTCQEVATALALSTAEVRRRVERVRVRIREELRRMIADP